MSKNRKEPIFHLTKPSQTKRKTFFFNTFGYLIYKKIFCFKKNERNSFIQRHSPRLSNKSYHDWPVIVPRLTCNRTTIDLQSYHDYPMNRPTIGGQSYHDRNWIVGRLQLNRGAIATHGGRTGGCVGGDGSTSVNTGKTLDFFSGCGIFRKRAHPLLSGLPHRLFKV